MITTVLYSCGHIISVLHMIADVTLRVCIQICMADVCSCHNILNQTACYNINIVQLHFRWPLQWRHHGPDGVSNHQPHHCLLNCLFKCRSKKTSKLRVTGLCEGNSPVTGEFPTERASNAENGSIWWRHHAKCKLRSEYTWCILSMFVLVSFSLYYFSW